MRATWPLIYPSYTKEKMDRPGASKRPKWNSEPCLRNSRVQVGAVRAAGVNIATRANGTKSHAGKCLVSCLLYQDDIGCWAPCARRDGVRQ